MAELRLVAESRRAWFGLPVSVSEPRVGKAGTFSVRRSAEAVDKERLPEGVDAFHTGIIDTCGHKRNCLPGVPPLFISGEELQLVHLQG